MGVATVKQAIVNKLGDMMSLKACYGYEATNVNGNYPFATVTLQGGTGEFRSTAHNLRTRLFTVHLYQEKMETGQGDERAESIITDVIDEMETAFDRDTTLSGICKFVQPVEWNAEYEDREHDERLLTITIQAVELPVVR